MPVIPQASAVPGWRAVTTGPSPLCVCLTDSVHEPVLNTWEEAGAFQVPDICSDKPTEQESTGGKP